MHTLQEAVATKLANSSNVIQNRVIDILAEQVLTKRVNALTAALTNLTNMEGELKKMRPDNITFNEDGSEASKTYTKASFEKKKQLVERITKMESAINAALEKNEYEQLNKLNGGGDNSSGG